MRPAGGPQGLSRRRFLGTSAIACGVLGAGWPAGASAQQAPAQPAPVDFDSVTEAARQRAQQPPVPPVENTSIFASFSYDDYQLIQFRPKHALWDAPGSTWRLMPFHIGWLFKEPVAVSELANGVSSEIAFTTDDFEYRGFLKDKVAPGEPLPGIVGFKLAYPLNAPDRTSEVVAFIGASYFRALGRDNIYGLSARGLSINSALSSTEEFPRFTAFWLDRAAPDAPEITILASLTSDSVEGAYRFVLRPGADTVMDVTARLFFRTGVEQLGVAPLSSMFFFGGSGSRHFDDYRTNVHDSDGLRIEQADGDVIWRPLRNPETLASSYFAMTRPRRFGLRQRNRDFDDYQDPGSQYELRPSVDVEPLGDWGSGQVRLFELPTNLEIHDNIGCFWVPDAPVKAGDMREFAYRLHWGMLTPDAGDELAHVASTRTGIGGASGLEHPPETHKFVVDFAGGMLARLPNFDGVVMPVVSVSGGKAEVVTLSKLSQDGDLWRLVIDVASDPGVMVELSAHIAGYGRKLSEIWTFQWVRT